MNSEISPFTFTPGNAGRAFIDTHVSEEVIKNFESDDSYKYVYKIVGLRGSGKSVEYSIIMNKFMNKENWLVYSLAAGGDPLQTLIGYLSHESLIDDKDIVTSIGYEGSVSRDALVVKGNVRTSINKKIQNNTNYYSDEAMLREMIKLAKDKK